MIDSEFVVTSTSRTRSRRDTEDRKASSLVRLQRDAGNSAVSELFTSESPVLDALSSSQGQPLEPALRSFMEDRLGGNFGDVRIHTDERSSESAAAIDAKAYTSGSDVVFGSGQYAPETPSGLMTLTHELVHVMQQKAGPVDGTPAPGGISISNPGDKHEEAADQIAAAALSGGAPGRGIAAGGPTQAGSVQRLFGLPEELPEMPSLGGMPEVPSMPTMPEMPSLPGGMPTMPEMPSLPGGMPTMPEMPSLPGGMPTMPELPGLFGGEGGGPVEGLPEEEIF